MTTWTVSDIMDIVREGVPFSDVKYINISSDQSNFLHLKVTCSVTLPLEKLRDISINGSCVQTFFSQLVHPELLQNGHQLEFNTYSSLSISEDKASLPVVLILDVNNISNTARKIRDSNFYSVLEAAIDN